MRVSQVVAAVAKCLQAVTWLVARAKKCVTYLFYKISNAYVLKSIFYQLDSNIQFFPLGICQNRLKKRSKNRQIFARFLLQSHNILWLCTSISVQNHNESSEPRTPHAPFPGTYPRRPPSAPYIPLPQISQYPLQGWLVCRIHTQSCLHQNQ